MPDVAYPLDQGLANLPTSYSPAPNPNNDYPLTDFKVIKKKFPTQIKHVGILWANATPSTMASEQAFERAARSQGFNIVYSTGFTPSQTTFLANVLTMKAKGVQMFFTPQMPDAYAATVAKEMQQQNFNPINIEGDAYSANLVKEGGPAVNNMYLVTGYLLYLDAEPNSPAVKLFTQWMNVADSNAKFKLQSALRVGRRRALRPGPARRRRESHPGQPPGGAEQDHVASTPADCSHRGPGPEHPRRAVSSSARFRTGR